MNFDTLELLIADCFEYIKSKDSKSGEFWSNQLFDDQGDIKHHLVNETTLQRLEKVAVEIYDFEGTPGT